MPTKRCHISDQPKEEMEEKKAFLFNCMPVGQTSDSMTVST